MPSHRRSLPRSAHGRQKPIDVNVARINMTFDKFQRNVFVTVGCMDWTIRVDRVPNEGQSDQLNVTLHNKTTMLKNWSARVYGSIYLVNVERPEDECSYAREILNAQFHETVTQIEFSNIATIDDILRHKQKFVKENEKFFTIVVVMKVTKCVAKFYAETSFCRGNNKGADVVVRVGKARFHVHKKYLAIHSTVFDRMFFGDFKESNEEEVTLNEVHVGDFRQLLLTIYPCRKPITDKSVHSLAHFADVYDMPAVHEWCENHLSSDKCALDIVTKFRLTQLYGYVNAETAILLKLGDLEELKKLLEANTKSEFLNDNIKTTLERKLAKAEVRHARKLSHAVLTEVAKAKLASKESETYKEVSHIRKEDLNKFRAVLVEKFGEKALDGVKITRDPATISYERLKREVIAERRAARSEKLLEHRRKRRQRKNVARKEKPKSNVSTTGGGIQTRPRSLKEKRLRKSALKVERNTLNKLMNTKAPSTWRGRFKARFGALQTAHPSQAHEQMDTSVDT